MIIVRGSEPQPAVKVTFIKFLKLTDALKGLVPMAPEALRDPVMRECFGRVGLAGLRPVGWDVVWTPLPQEDTV